MSTLRVALDARSLQEVPLGGIGRSTRTVIEAVRSDVALTLLTDARRSPIDIDLPQVPCRAPLSGTKTAWLQLAAPRALRGFDGIFHCPWYGLPFRQSVPMVVTIYDLTFETGGSGFRPTQRAAYRAQARWAARTAAHVLTGSEAVRRQLCTDYGIEPERVTVQPSPLDRSLDGSDPARVGALRDRLGIGGRYVVAIGGAPRRRLDLVLAAWPSVRARVPEVSLVVLGPEIPPSPPPDVIAAGAVDDGDWADALAGASALVYPTEYEGFGYPALEAMAAGTPVVCAPVGALPELLGNAACWMQTHDKTSVADATIALLTNAGLADRLIAAGRLRTAHAAALDTLRERVLTAYEKAADSG
jgi:glycosyltransferase involved in cell wall biosynthesis